jgi:hypothetical protein
MQKTTKEVAHPATSHNQKQQHKQCNHKTQKPANRPQEVVYTEPKTTTNRKQPTAPNTLPQHQPQQALILKSRCTLA